MDRTQVATHYRGKGYQVHDSIVVEGRSGSHRVPMLCEGALGNLIVFFGDSGGIDSPEIGAAKRIARDLGATAVVAAATFTGEQRKTAADLGVVLLDDALLAAPAPAPPASAAPNPWPSAANPREALDRDLAAHPWPDSGRPGGYDGPSRNVTYEVDDLLARFDKKSGAANPSLGPVAPAVPPAAAPASAPASPPQREPASAPGLDGGLWKHPRPGQPSAAPAPPPATPSLPAAVAAGTRFAWLNLPKAAEAAPAAEYEGTLSTRRARLLGQGAVPAADGQEAGDLAAVQRRRRVLRRVAWLAAIGLALYLLLLWWF